MSNRVIVESLIRDNSVNGVSRISALVNGLPLWFESSDTDLSMSPEGFASALLVPAMSHGLDLVFENPLSPVWLENSRMLMEYFSKHWNWRPIKIESAPSSRLQTCTQTAKRALCFSGGVDSFYSLLTYPEQINTLITVHGYDIRLSEDKGGHIACDHVRQVAAAMNIDAVIVRTNYREHPVAGRKYKYSYGGALSGIGHLVNNTGELIISSGLRFDEVFPNGSQWQTDPFWSSETMKVVHYGAHFNRDQKLRAIAANPLVPKHLRVCQENLERKFEISDFLNCGRCQKCIRTLLVLQQENILDKLETFQNKKDLDIYLDNLMEIGDYLFASYEEICRRGIDKKYERSIRALICRSRFFKKIKCSGRSSKRRVFKLLRLADALKRKLHL